MTNVKKNNKRNKLKSTFRKKNKNLRTSSIKNNKSKYKKKDNRKKQKITIQLKTGGGGKGLSTKQLIIKNIYNKELDDKFKAKAPLPESDKAAKIDLSKTMNEIVDIDKDEDEGGPIKKDTAIIHLKTLKQFITNIIKLKTKKDKVLNSVNDKYEKLPNQIKEKFMTDGFSYENLYKRKTVGLLKSGNTKKAEKIYKDFKETYLNESGIEDLTSLIDDFMESLENVEEETEFSKTEIINNDIEPEVTTSKKEEEEEKEKEENPELTTGGSKNDELDKEIQEIKTSILEIVNKQKQKEDISQSDTQIDKSSSASKSSSVKTEVIGEPISSASVSGSDNDLVQAVHGVEDAVRNKNKKSSMANVMTNMMGEEKKPAQVDCPPPPDQKSITISAPAGYNIATEGGPGMDNKLSGVKAVLSNKGSAPIQEGGKKSKKYRRFKLRKRTRKRNKMLNKKK